MRAASLRVLEIWETKLNEMKMKIKRRKEESPVVLILQAVRVVQIFSTKKHRSFEQEGHFQFIAFQDELTFK